MTSKPSGPLAGLTASSDGYELDLHDAFSSFTIYYEKRQVPWFERSWGPLLYSFDSFLSFGWSAMVVVNRDTGKAHIVVQQKSVGAFAKMIKVKFYEELPKLPNPLPIIPAAHAVGPIRNLSTQDEYNKLHATLRAAEFDALKERVMGGDFRSIKGLWDSRRFTFLALNFEHWEKNPTLILETGTASMRCAHIDGAGIWPPVPDTNYRRSHLVVTPHNSKSLNVKRPNLSAGYALGSSYLSDSVGLVQYLSSIVASIASPDSKDTANTLVLVGHNIGETLHRLRELGRTVVFPSNALIVDVASLERSIFRSQPRRPGSSTFNGRDPQDRLSLLQTLGMLKVPVFCELGNAGNDAFYTLVAFQMLLDPSTPRPQPHYPQPQTFGHPKPMSRTTSASSIALARPLPKPTPPENTRRNSLPARSSPLATQTPVVGSPPARPTRLAPPSAFAGSNGTSATSASSSLATTSAGAKSARRASSAPPSAAGAPPFFSRRSSSSITPSPDPKFKQAAPPPSAFASPSPSPDPITTVASDAADVPKARRRKSFLGRMLSSSKKDKKEQEVKGASSSTASSTTSLPHTPAPSARAQTRSPSSKPPTQPAGSRPDVLSNKEARDAARKASTKAEEMEAYARKWDGIRLETGTGHGGGVKEKGQRGVADGWEYV